MIASLYLISYVIHIYAFILGLMCIKAGEQDFKSLTAPIRFKWSNIHYGTSPFCFSWTKADAKYWAVNIGTSVNIVFLVILPIYLYSSVGFLPIWQELAFNYVHIGTAISAGLVHTITFKEIKGGGLHGDFRKNN